MQGLIRRRRAVAGIGLLAAIGVVSVTGCAPFFNKLADTVLANEVRFDDREAPRTAYAIAASADRVQLAGGQGSGLSCSLPPGAQLLAFGKSERMAPIALQMRQACAFHDYCYRHGNATYGYSQSDCDFMLQQQAFRLCKFINRQASISKCETDARKVTLGVRLGGYGSFKRARAEDDGEASTFLEFDPYPVRSTSYRVVRVADAPRQWVQAGMLPKAAYHFEIRPAGSQVHIVGWKSDGAMVCTRFQLNAVYRALNGAPMVARDSGGEDWFVWWQRSELAATHGQFALLPPGRASARDWATVAGGMVPGQGGSCDAPPLPSGQDVSPLAFVTGNVEPQVSELHPGDGPGVPGVLRLMGLSTHSCKDGDVSPCLVDVLLDTRARQFFGTPPRPASYRAIDRNCTSDPDDGQPREGCDRYRNFVGAPTVVAHPTHPSLLWLRRGAANGDGYQKQASVRRYAVGLSRDLPATNMGELTLAGFGEAMEPAFILDPAAARPTFVSMARTGNRFSLRTHTAAAAGPAASSASLDCFPEPDAAWLQRPPALVADRRDPRIQYIVFSRTHLGPVTAPYKPDAVLEVAVATLADGRCVRVRKAPFRDFFDGFAAPDELKPPAGEAGAAPGRYAARVRGGQLVVADVTGDGVADLVQVARIPKTLRMRSSVLVGKLDDAGLQFAPLGSAPP